MNETLGIQLLCFICCYIKVCGNTFKVSNKSKGQPPPPFSGIAQKTKSRKLEFWVPQIVTQVKIILP
jgi:hypothetical protein